MATTKKTRKPAAPRIALREAAEAETIGSRGVYSTYRVLDAKGIRIYVTTANKWAVAKDGLDAKEPWVLYRVGAKGALKSLSIHRTSDLALLVARKMDDAKAKDAGINYGTGRQVTA